MPWLNEMQCDIAIVMLAVVSLISVVADISMSLWTELAYFPSLQSVQTHYHQLWSTSVHPRSGRPCDIALAKDSFIHFNITRLLYRFSQTTKSAHNIPCLRQVSLQTLWLWDINFTPKRPALIHVPVLSDHHRQACWVWAQQHDLWPLRWLKDILF